MTNLEAFFVIAGVASIAAIPIAIYYARRQSQRRKFLVYRSYLARLPLISARSLRNYQLSVVFRPEGKPEERISTGFVHFLGFANLGRDPIWRAEIAPASPLRIEVTGARVLDMALEAVHRQVSNIKVESQLDSEGEGATGHIDFDFLDHRDGGLIRVLTTGVPKEVKLVGDVVGMPSGIINVDDVQRRSILGKVATFLVAGLFVTALALTPVVVRWASGSWSDAWILALPVVAILVPLLIVLLVNVTIWPKGPQLPRELLPRFRGHPPPIFYENMYFSAGPIAIEHGVEYIDERPQDVQATAPTHDPSPGDGNVRP